MTRIIRCETLGGGVGWPNGAGDESETSQIGQFNYSERQLGLIWLCDNSSKTPASHSSNFLWLGKQLTRGLPRTGCPRQ